MIAFISRFTERQSRGAPTYLARFVSRSKPGLVVSAGILAGDVAALNAEPEPQRAARVHEKWEALKALDGTPGITVRVVRRGSG